MSYSPILPGGFPQIWEQIAQQSVSQIRSVILAAATDWQESHHFLAKLSGKPLLCFVPSAQAACLAVLSCYFPNTAEAAESRTSSAATKYMTLRAYFQQLYGYATGWLGWTSSVT